MIQANNLYKSFQNGTIPVLNGLSLEIPQGKFVAITGASGSGKSTALNILSGLERPDSGEVLYNGRNICKYSDRELTNFRRENVGFIFQKYYLLPHLSVENNVKLGADLVGNKNYKEIVEAVGLTEKLKRKPCELSGGEQQRVCIARALAKKPHYLFADEPTGALDEQTGRDVLHYILQLKRQLHFTMIMVTHNQNVAETADTVIKMNSGKITDVMRNSTPKSAFEIGW